ncbi:MAG: heavy metal translocating P-type ATPase [Chloroflexota bacterium]|nr:heavy metal translocating P-type ATPase [Chloroflexota bacterium]
MTTLVKPLQDQPTVVPRWRTKDWLEPRLVVVTLIALLSSIALGNAGAPAALILIANLISYGAGGLYGAQEVLIGLRILKPSAVKAAESDAPTGKIVINVDLLMLLAAFGAALIDQWHEGALLLFLFSLSNVLQDYAIGRSRQAIKSLMKLYPAEAKIKRGNGVEVVQIDAIRAGDVLLIAPGERIAVDGVVRAGHSTVDQSPITGESMPVEKAVGEKVFAGTLNGQGALDVEAASSASDTVLARIIRLVEEAQDSKAPTERFLERFEQIYAVVIISAVGLFIVVPPALGLVDFSSNFYRAMVLMTVASPCALVISTPASFISAIASGARAGVLFKGGAYLEALASIKAVAFDKTGTLTAGKPSVTDIVPAPGIAAADVLRVAAAVESRSEHPLAAAVVRAYEKQPEGVVSDFAALPGRGVTALVDGRHVEVGSPIHLGAELPADMDAARVRMEEDGKTVMIVRQDDAIIGMIALADTLRPEAVAMIRTLKAQGVQVVMLTGDNQRAAAAMARAAGVDRVLAELLPDDKVTAIKQIMGEIGAVAMVGDGVNDAPALATATVGIAMGAAGTDAALETADVVLMGDKLDLIPYAIGLSKKARRVVWQNIVFSLAVIGVLIAGAFLIDLPLPLGVMGHEGSTVIVVLNGLIQLLIIPTLALRTARQLVKAV